MRYFLNVGFSEMETGVYVVPAIAGTAMDIIMDAVRIAAPILLTVLLEFSINFLL
jgi:hypothetical protein